MTRRRLFAFSGAAVAATATGTLLSGTTTAFAGGTVASPEWIGSPHFTSGRAGVSIDRIVIHHMSGTLASTDSWFNNASSEVSAQYGIGEGEVHQYVSEANTAWHAGNLAMNRRSIGIELSGTASREASADTYSKVISLAAGLCATYGINPDSGIIGHSDVIATQCPGLTDLSRIRSGVKGQL